SRLLRVEILCGAPTDGDYRRLSDSIVQGGVQCREEAVVGAQGKINGYPRVGRQGPSHLDIQHDFAVRLRVRAGNIGADTTVTGHADSRQLRHRQPERSKISLQVRDAKARAGGMVVLIEVVQLNDGDALAVAVQPGREVVKPGDFRGGESAVGGVRRSRL